MIFPYVFSKGKHLPIVPLEIEGKTWEWTEGYVDSGASYSIFHSDIAEILEIDLEKGEKTFLTVGDGSLIPCFKHSLKVKFAEKEFIAKIGFSRKLGIGFNILGRESFFDNFVFCFDDRKRELRVV